MCTISSPWYVRKYRNSVSIMPNYPFAHNMTGVALKENEGAPVISSFTIADYLYGSVNFDVPSEVIVKICLDRDIDYHSEAMNVEKSQRDLCKADLLVWMALGVSKRSNNVDSDNGWSHSNGGYTLTEADKELFLKTANAIYEENGESTIGKTKAKIQSFGIKPANIGIDGMPLPYIVK